MAILATSVIGLLGIVVGIVLIRLLLLEPLLAEVRGRREASLHLRAPSIEFRLEVKAPIDAPKQGDDRISKGKSGEVTRGGTTRPSRSRPEGAKSSKSDRTNRRNSSGPKGR